VKQDVKKAIKECSAMRIALVRVGSVLVERMSRGRMSMKAVKTGSRLQEGAM
jgi:hypothetical protein